MVQITRPRTSLPRIRLILLPPTAARNGTQAALGRIIAQEPPDAYDCCVFIDRLSVRAAQI
jgi:hypothetical protein